MNLKTSKTHRIVKIGREWRLAQDGDGPGEVTEAVVELSIEGDEENGYYLCMWVEGSGSYDKWYRTSDEALAGARADYAVLPEEWSKAEE